MKSLSQLYLEGSQLYGENPHHFTDKGSWHTYLDFYQELFAKYDNDFRLLDIGINAGGSLWLWTNYLDNYNIWAVDIMPTYIMPRPFQSDLDQNPNLHIQWDKDSTDAGTYNSIPEQFDIIIDDGDHRPEMQVKTFMAAWPKLATHGTYVIEDVRGVEQVGYLLYNIRKVYPNTKFDFYFGTAENAQWNGIGINDDIIITVSNL